MKTNNDQQITVSEYKEIFADIYSAEVARTIEENKLQYKLPTHEERDRILRTVIETLLDPKVVRAGEHRHEQWEKGWGENLAAYSTSHQRTDIMPKYFGKYNILRWKQQYILPVDKDFETHSLQIITDTLFDTNLKSAQNIYEFGCGTGHNLLRARKYNKNATLYGLDWASSSQKLIEKMREDGLEEKIFGHNFNFFKPDYTFDIKPNNVVYTVAALEQIGDKFDAFIDYLLEKKPDLCFHIEPINELLDEQNLLDYLSLLYFKKRNYLWGYLSRLRELEKEGKVKIIKATRSYIGSMYIDGYSIVVWKPIQ